MKATLESLAEKMRDIDFTMLSTHTKDGQIGARPMSNNRDVAYDGDSYYFTTDDIKEFLEATWTVHFNSSRTGVRLIGPSPKWARADGGEARHRRAHSTGDGRASARRSGH